LTDDQSYGKWLFAQECNFMLGVASHPQLPPDNLPEVAFAGRSNVGKSSLVNALTGRKTLAKTSNTPGRTQQLNYFNLGNKVILVDLPGYGFAKAPKKQVDTWTQLIHDYLKGRASLQRVFVLIDSRHGIKASDETMMNELDSVAVSYQLVMTKSDKISEKVLEEVYQGVLLISKKHVACHPEIVITSSEKKSGIDELRAIIGKFVDDPS
jgi:GTP-binding protein